MEKKRIEYIDIAKGIGILLVILGHMENLTSTVWKQFAASFHMPLFFFISGMLVNTTDDDVDIVKDIKCRFKRLLIPYFLWGFIYMEEVNVENILRLCWGNNKLYGAAGLWFLPTLYVAEIVIKFICRAYEKGKWRGYLWVMSCFLTSVTLDIISDKTIIGKVGYPFSFDIALTAAIFMFFGYLYHKKVNREVIPWRIGCKIIIFFGLVFIISRLNYRYINDFAFERVVMARASYGNYFLFLIGGIVGSIACINLGKLINKNAVLEYIGRNSLVFMCTNHVAISLINECLSWLGIDFGASMLQNSIIFMVMFIICIIICTMSAVVVNKFVPILKGR